ncbi:MAG: DUF1217 domain-containing protein [Pseudomonadota bacterium]
MTFQPIVPVSGYGGWKFLQSTYSTQLETFADAPQIQRDREYVLEKLSQPMEVETFLDDRRLMRITMTAYDLVGEEWKRGFVDKVLDEVGDPESTFLARLNNPAYTAFAEGLKPVNGKINLSADALADIADQFETVAFRTAVGDVDDNMRLSLNYQSKIVDLVGVDQSDEAILFRLLGSLPVRAVLETSLNLPAEFSQLDLDKQAEILQDGLQSKFGITDLSDLTSLEAIDDVLKRFHAINSIQQGPSLSSPGASALAILNPSFGFGSTASQNLFLAGLG